MRPLFALLRLRPGIGPTGLRADGRRCAVMASSPRGFASSPPLLLRRPAATRWPALYRRTSRGACPPMAARSCCRPGLSSLMAAEVELLQVTATELAQAAGAELAMVVVAADREAAAGRY